MKTILMLPFKLFSILFGKISWTAPAWISVINGVRKKCPKAFWGTITGLILVVIGYQYYQTLPKPITVTAEIFAPDITLYYENAKPENLDIEFVYDYSSPKQDQHHPSGDPSVARIDLVGEEIVQGITLSPTKKGTWRWLDDRRIQFVPETDWPAGVQYDVILDKTIFSSETKLSKNSYKFKTQNFEIEFIGTQFYQDPQEISVRRVVSTIKFTHPVDKESFEKSVTMGMRPSDSSIDTKLKSYKFDITYDKNSREAYLQSEPLSLPSEPNYMVTAVDRGVKTLLGGNASQEKIYDKVLIPDIYSFLKVSMAKTNIIRNQKNEPEQVMMLEFTDDLDEKELLDKLSLYLLPKYNETKGKSYWKSPREVSEEVLRNSKKLDLRLISNQRTFSKLYSFVFDAPEKRYLYVKINSGFTSVNKFVHSSFYDDILRAPTYPKEVNIAGDGSVLTYSGDHYLSVLTRGIPGIKYNIGRLLKGQIYHLISQTSGDINNPAFDSYEFNQKNVSEFETEYVDINAEHPRIANYSSLDLSQYMPAEEDRFGLFFVEAKGWDRMKKREIYGAKDTRLILVTDLGLIVKDNADHTHHVFVQSIQTGEPVSGAKVELLGKNGVPIYTKFTAEDGHVKIPSTRDFKNEKQPTVYVVKTASDLSFIPFNRRSRQINLSKFDIGGVSTRYFKKDALNAYLFSDRGIYRPGEKVNIGIIVKYFDLNNIEGIPLEVVVRGPRNNEVKVTRVSLSEKGFFDFNYSTEAASDTGRYKVSLHLVRDNKHRGKKIGEVEFKLEEFQPDSMKIESKLVDVKEKGWSTNEKLTANVTLKNLFGVPAQDRNVKGQVIIKPVKFSFKNYKDYHFTVPYFSEKNKPLSINEMLETQKTDVGGKVVFSIDLQRFRAGTYNLQFIAEGFDQAGGRSVLATNSALISPLTHIIGHKAEGKLSYINAGSKRKIEFIAIDTELEQTYYDGLVLKQIEIQTVSTLVKQRNGTYKYQTVKKEKELNHNPLEISITGFEYNIDTTQPGDFALEIYDDEERRLSRIEYSVVGYGNLAGKIEKNAELQLRLDKEDYLPNELISMSIKAPYAGSGLISIETDKVHSFKWFKTDSESTVQSIRVPEGLEGTGYVNVAFVRDVSSKEIFTSPLSYAVQPFSIDRSNRTIDIALDVKDIVRPGKPMKIGFSTSKESKIAVFAIDEGILQVAKYKEPDPLGYFLKKRALDVNTLQILDLILPEFDLIRELSASGGGARARKALAKNLNPFSRKTDKPAVYWSGIVDANEGKTFVTFDVPNTFAGSLVVMAVAVSEDSMGIASDSAIARGPFVISPNVLTQTAPGDEFLVTVGVANIIDGSGKDAEVSIDVKPSEHLEIVGTNQANLKIDEGSEGRATFKVKAKSILGAGELVFTAKHKNEDFSRTASLSVRPAMPYSASFESGFEQSATVQLTSSRKLYTNLAEQSVSASASPLVIVDGLISYLEAFPHGCTEQVVSKVFPLVGLMTHPAYAPHVPNIKKHFEHVITRLRERQQGDGGFAFWPGGTRSAEYPTIYIMHFLVEAKDLGYPVPTGMIERGQSYLNTYVGKSAVSFSEARDRANAIYLLTRLGAVTTNYLIDLEEYLEKEYEKEWRKDLLSTYMAASYKLLQKDDVANNLIKGYQLGQNHGSSLLDDFHSVLALDAQYIYLLTKHFEDKAKNLKGEELLKLTNGIFKGQYNTISSAYSILALGAYSKLVLANEFNEVIDFTGISETGEESKLNAGLKPFLTAKYPVSIEGLRINGNQPLYYLNVQSGFDKVMPTDVIKDGIEIHRDFLDKEGNKVTSFVQGEEITVRLRVRALGDKLLTNIAVVDLLPGGFEIIRSSVSRTAYNWRAEYIDIREDRIVYYGSFDKSVHDLTYKVKLTSAGKFIIPPSYAESMYDRSIRSISKWGKFTVYAPGEP